MSSKDVKQEQPSTPEKLKSAKVELVPVFDMNSHSSTYLLYMFYLPFKKSKANLIPLKIGAASTTQYNERMSAYRSCLKKSNSDTVTEEMKDWFSIKVTNTQDIVKAMQKNETKAGRGTICLVPLAKDEYSEIDKWHKHGMTGNVFTLYSAITD